MSSPVLGITYTERYFSRDLSAGVGNLSYKRHLVAHGSGTPNIVYLDATYTQQAPIAVTPGVNAYPTSIDVTRLGENACDVIITYALPGSTGVQTAHDGTSATEQVTLSPAGDTKHINIALARYSVNHSSGALEDAAPHFGIAVDKDGVAQGLDIQYATEQLTVTIYKPPATVTKVYRNTLRAKYYTTNASAWKDWEAEEVLFNGVSYDQLKNTGSLVKLTFSFLARRGETVSVKFQDGSTQSVTKPGWWYMDTKIGVGPLGISPGAGIETPKPGILDCFINRVYPTSNFSTIPLDPANL